MDDPQVGKQGNVFGAQSNQGVGGQIGQVQAPNEEQFAGGQQAPVNSQTAQPIVGQSQQPVQPNISPGNQDEKKPQVFQQPQQPTQVQTGVAQTKPQPQIQQSSPANEADSLGERVQQPSGTSLGGQPQVNQAQREPSTTVAEKQIDQSLQAGGMQSGEISSTSSSTASGGQQVGQQSQQALQQIQNQDTQQQQQQVSAQPQPQPVSPSGKPEAEPVKVDVGAGVTPEVSEAKHVEAVDQSQIKQEAQVDQQVSESISVTEIPKEPEISEEVQAWMERVKSDDVVDPKPVKHGRTTVVSPADPQQVEVELPVTKATYEKGFKYKTGFSLRWLVEWCKRVIGVHKGKTGFKKQE